MEYVLFYILLYFVLTAFQMPPQQTDGVQTVFSGTVLDLNAAGAALGGGHRGVAVPHGFEERRPYLHMGYFSFLKP